VKYVDASALLRILFGEPGPSVPLAGGDRLVSSRMVEVETFRAVDRERLLGHIDDTKTAVKRKELTDLLAMIDLLTVDDEVIDRARAPFAVTVRALDAIHVATAEVLVGLAEGESVEFWTHDERQATAALSRGLTVRGASEIRSNEGPAATD
jgi:predicted nucleic acid-binding protein